MLACTHRQQLRLCQPRAPAVRHHTTACVRSQVSAQRKSSSPTAQLAEAANIEQAIETGEGDWGTFDARLKQAEADSKRLSELLQKAAASHRV